MAISDLIKVTKSKIKQYYDSQNVIQCRCRLHSYNHGKIVKTSTTTFNVLPYEEKNPTLLNFNYISVEKLLSLLFFKKN